MAVAFKNTCGNGFTATTKFQLDIKTYFDTFIANSGSYRIQ